MTGRAGAAFGALLLLGAGAARGQGYTLRVDAGLQAVSFRGYSADSIRTDSVVVGSDGGLYTPTGYAVSCTSGMRWCNYWVPGPIRSTNPAVAQAALTMWGLGVPGLRIQVNTFATTDFSNSAYYPGTSPNLQLVEGYAEYAAPAYTVAAGRKIVTGRLGTYSFDGGQATGRLTSAGLTLSGYLGLGLAQGTNVPITSSSVDPQEEYRPAESPIVAGLIGTWLSPRAEVTGEYRREVDQTSNYFASERVAGAVTVRPVGALSLTGGAIYDMASGLWGSADAAARYTTPRLGLVAGYRRYAPFFELWTVWGAFSPVPYTAWYGSGTFQATPRLQLRLRGEAYEFQDAEAEAPLVQIESSGWRGSGGVTYRFPKGWEAQAGYHNEFGPGAASSGWDGSVSYAPTGRYSVMLYGNSLERPLEYRWDDSKVLVYGMQASVVARDNLTVAFTMARYDEDRERPDAAAFEWDQIRAGVKVVMTFSSADRLPLPRAISGRPAGY